MTGTHEPKDAAPLFRGTLTEDADALTQSVQRGETLLGRLPTKPRRDAAQQRAATDVLTLCNRLRTQFLTAHAGSVYDAVTESRTRSLRLTELLFTVSEVFPGLVPDRAHMAAEGKRPQADKDGLEIAQGIFLRAVLNDELAGRHLMNVMLQPTQRATALREQFTRGDRVELETVVVERRGAAAHVTLHNLQCLNAEDNRLVDDLETAIDLVLLDDRIRVGVLRGGVMTHPRYRGRRVFSAGINLAALDSGEISFLEFLMRRELACIGKIVWGLTTAEQEDPVGYVLPAHKPWAAAVDSFAIGGGMQLLLVFDWVIAASDTYFSLPAAQEGIVPGAANLRLTRFTGSRLARRLILGGRRIRALDREAALVCDEVVEPEEVDAAVERAADALDNPAVVANRHMLNHAEESPEAFRRYLAEFAFIQSHRLYDMDVLDKLRRTWSTSRRVGA
ncbi:(3,5-dihydroxyphenyl)acetyl-CoA 1,2-dioxygenase DpgC [Streptomyces sp. NPDC006739]|uniref:(3,5-dihydroxyphenyl)acetyl-CoA 1,2-dioxygenase DpgC n=1 Tax=Streptomyces sp. NPDC006739 TaxID=3364763 RepID=UPI00367BBF1D